MRLAAHYSHLNGLEFLQVRRAGLWNEIRDILTGVNAANCKTKVSKERRMKGRALYSPIDMNDAIAQGFAARQWSERRTSYWVAGEAKLIRRIMHLSAQEQKAEIEAAGQDPIPTYNQTDFVKERVAVEVQFGKYPFVAYDLFVKHMAFFVGDVIDVGVEILPAKELQAQMSSGVGYYERELYNLIRGGRGVPAVPLVLIGLAP